LRLPLIALSLLFLTAPASGEGFKAYLKGALKNSPALASYGKEAEAVELFKKEASTLPNPEVELEVENFLGTGGFRGFKSAETGIYLSQRFPLPKKVKRKREALEARLKVIFGERRARELSIFKEVGELYAGYLYQRERAELYREFLELSKELLEVARARFEGGKAAYPEVLAAQAEVERWKGLREESLRELEGYRKALERLTGVKGEPEGELYSLKPLPEKLSPNHPLISVAEAEAEVLKKEAEAAKAESLPDLKVSGGFRHFNAEDDFAFTFGVALELPLFNRNRFRAKALEKRGEAKLLLAQQQRLELEREFTLALSRGRALAQKVKTIEGELLPKLKELNSLLLEAYRLGRAPITQLLDARRRLLQEKMELLNTYYRYHLIRVELHAVAGATPENLF